MKKLALIALFPLIAACDDGYTTEAELTAPLTDNTVLEEVKMQEVDVVGICPVDVSEADRALYPACE